MTLSKKAELPFVTFKAESVLTSQKADVEAAYAPLMMLTRGRIQGCHL